MYFPRLVSTSAFILFIFCTLALPQTSPTESKSEKDEAREKLEKQAYKLLDEALGEAESLKLWENRALAFAMAGDLIWKVDQKRAKQLFQNSADELIQGAIQPKQKSKDYFEEYSYWQQRSPRRVIMLMIANHDADFALELLKDTRPANIQAALDAKNTPQIKGQKKSAVDVLNNQRNSYLVQQELSLEQQFAVKAAEQNPDKAAKLIRESLSKGVSMSAINLVQKVTDKNEDLGKELLGEVIDKLLNSQFKQAFNSEVSIAQYLLTQSSRPQTYKSRNPKFKQLKIEDGDLRAIANKVADFYLQTTDFQSFYGLGQNMGELKKYAPSKAEALKKKEQEMSKVMPESLRSYQDMYKKMNDPNAKPEELIAEAKNYPGWQKLQLYQSAINKAIESGETDKVRQLINAEPQSKQRDDALSHLNSKLSSKAIKDGKLDDAKSLIDQTESESSKIVIMVDLAIGFEKKNTEEDHKNAVRLIEDASQLVNQVPESRKEVNDILKVVSGLAIIDPEKAYPYLTNLMYMANDMMTAYALIAKYNKRSNSFKNGEIIFTQNVSRSFSNYGEALAKLAAHDFGKTVSLIDQFQRQDVKTLAKLLFAQSIIKNKMNLEGNRQYNVVYGF